MELGYDRPLYLLAFDHRGSFEKGLFGATAPITPTVHAGIVDAKHLIFEAFALAVADGVPKEAAGVLVDEEYGAEVARAATAGGYALAMPVERSGQDEFDFEYGDDFGRHIEDFDPTFAKVLVRYNPEGDAGAEPPSNRASPPAERLAPRTRSPLPVRAPRAADVGAARLV